MGLLGTPQRLESGAGGPRRDREVPASGDVAARGLKTACQIGDAPTEVLLSAGERISGTGRRRHAPAGKEIEHLASAHPLTCCERGRAPAAGALDLCELTVHLPLVGQVIRPAPLERQPAGDPLRISGRCLELGRRCGESAARAQLRAQSRVQVPGDVRRQSRAQPIQSAPIQRVGSEWPAVLDWCRRDNLAFY